MKKNYILSDLVKIKYGKNQLKVVDENGEYPILGTGGLMGYANQYLYNRPSVLIGRKGSIKNVKYIDKPFWTVDTLFYTIINEELVSPKYLFYKLSKYDLSVYNEGSAVPSLTVATLKQIKLDIPSLPEQKRIVDILTSLDDKIELNNQMNQTLEEMATVLYKQWFVDFEFPNEDGKPYKSSGGEMVESELGLIPKGWEVKELGEFFPIITGKKNANVATDNGKYRFFTCSQNYSLTDNFEFDAGAILVAGNGDFSVKWYRGKFDAYQRTYVLIPHDQKNLALLFVIIKECLSDITKGSHGSVIKFLTKGMLENYKIAWPADVDVFSSVFTDLNLKIEKNNSEIESLRLQKQVLLEELI